MVPFPFDKAYALRKYCDERKIAHREVVYIGDDYGPGGNDESVLNPISTISKLTITETSPKQSSNFCNKKV